MVQHSARRLRRTIPTVLGTAALASLIGCSDAPRHQGATPDASLADFETSPTAPRPPNTLTLGGGRGTILVVPTFPDGSDAPGPVQVHLDAPNGPRFRAPSTLREAPFVLPDVELGCPFVVIAETREVRSTLIHGQPLTMNGEACAVPLPCFKGITVRSQVDWPDGSPARDHAFRLRIVGRRGRTIERTVESDSNGLLLCVFEGLWDLHGFTDPVLTVQEWGTPEPPLSGARVDLDLGTDHFLIEAPFTLMEIPPFCTGRVIDDAGQPIPGVSIMLHALHSERTSFTSAHGPNTPPPCPARPLGPLASGADGRFTCFSFLRWDPPLVALDFIPASHRPPIGGDVGASPTNVGPHEVNIVLWRSARILGTVPVVDGALQLCVLATTTRSDGTEEVQVIRTRPEDQGFDLVVSHGTVELSIFRLGDSQIFTGAPNALHTIRDLPVAPGETIDLGALTW